MTSSLRERAPQQDKNNEDEDKKVQQKPEENFGPDPIWTESMKAAYRTMNPDLNEAWKPIEARRKRDAVWKTYDIDELPPVETATAPPAGSLIDSSLPSSRVGTPKLEPFPPEITQPAPYFKSAELPPEETRQNPKS